jgi:hypothetical protein
MRYVDDPVPYVRRTPRELLILTVGVLMVARSIRDHDTSWNAPVTALVTILFAARFFAARVAGLALCVSALALCAALALEPQEHIALWGPAAAQFGIGALLLASRDLRTRFDDTGHGLGLRTYWRDVPTADRRSIVRVVCVASATAALLHHAAHGAAAWGAPYLPPAWPQTLVLIAIAGGLLLVLGRAAGFVVAAAFGVLVLVRTLPLWHAARAAGGPDSPADWLYVSGGHVVMACVCAAATVAATLPWLGRLARRALPRGD